MLFICVNATSASDTLETNLTSEDTADIQSVDAVDASQDKLSSSGDTLVVDGNGEIIHQFLLLLALLLVGKQSSSRTVIIQKVQEFPFLPINR